MGKFKTKMYQFMQGRYGSDDLAKFLLGVGMVCVVLSFFVRSRIWSPVLMAIIVLCYYRMFSRNIPKRYEENQKFLALKGRTVGRLVSRKAYLAQNKAFHIYKCPTCKQKIRVPRGKGKISIHCPSCNTDFIKKS